MVAASISDILFHSMKDRFRSEYKEVYIGSEKSKQIGFFPACSGYGDDANSQYSKDILILGQDFGTKDEFDKIIKGEFRDTDTKTWIELKAILNLANIRVERCFFSNVFMGFRKSGVSTGRFPGLNDIDYLEANKIFLLEQISTINPKAIIVMGRYAAEELAKYYEELREWNKYKTIKDKDKNGKTCINAEIDGLRIKFIAITHPSMARLNNKNRKYNNKNGIEADSEMIKESMR